MVTGSSNSGILTVKLATEDGASRWEVRQDGLVNRFDTAQAVAFDGAGDVIVAGLAAAVSSAYGLDLVRVQPSPVIQSSQRNPDGSMDLRIGGRADWTYSLEASTNLMNWTPLREVPSEGLTTPFRDTPPAGEALRFYRAALKR